MFLHGKKSFILKIFFTEKNFFAETNLNKNVKICISFEKYIFIFSFVVFKMSLNLVSMQNLLNANKC